MQQLDKAVCPQETCIAFMAKALHSNQASFSPLGTENTPGEARSEPLYLAVSSSSGSFYAFNLG